MFWSFEKWFFTVWLNDRFSCLRFLPVMILLCNVTWILGLLKCSYQHSIDALLWIKWRFLKESSIRIQDSIRSVSVTYLYILFTSLIIIRNKKIYYCYNLLMNQMLSHSANAVIFLTQMSKKYFDLLNEIWKEIFIPINLVL